VDDSPDQRPPLVVAAEWTSRVTTISLEMVLPGLIGFWIDRQLGTVMVFLVLGVIVGMTAGMIHLVRLTSLNDTAGRRHGKPSRESSEDRPKDKPEP